MNEMAKKIHEEIIEKYKPTIQQFIDAKMDKRKIINIINNHIQNRMKEYYNYDLKPTSFHSIIDSLKSKFPDSRAEDIFYSILENEKIPFKFHYKIGPYEADYLIDEDLVLELDGPIHNQEKQQKHDEKRDKYLVKMGYRILRIPIFLVALDKHKILNLIQDNRSCGKNSNTITGGLCPECQKGE